MDIKGDDMSEKTWNIYIGNNEPHDGIKDLPEAPPWRSKDKVKDEPFTPNQEEIEMVNAALYLRRPLLITGKPGVGKSALARSIAHELGLGTVLPWHVTTKSTLKEALYEYDAIARLHDVSLKQDSRVKIKIGKYITLGALGTAFSSKAMRVVLIDEIDKSDIDLPNDLLHVLEENEFLIPELLRSDKGKMTVSTCDGQKAIVTDGRIQVDSNNFPLIIMTSNGEREFPPAFMRRCIHMEMTPRNGIDELKKIITRHLGLTPEQLEEINELLEQFDAKDKEKEYLSVDQLLNAVFLKLHGVEFDKDKTLLKNIWKALSV
jgi:MoxR-like ATPase